MNAINTAPAAATPPYVLHSEDSAAIEHEIRHYEDPRAASIGALKIIQKRHGWVPDAALPAIGELLGISTADLEGVATFYNLIFRRPVGRYVIKVCDSIACFLTGFSGSSASALVRPRWMGASRCCRSAAWGPATKARC